MNPLHVRSRHPSRRALRGLGAALALLAAVAPGARPQADFSALLAQLAPAVVHVDVPGVSFGSGFVVQHTPPGGDPELAILTACHVVVEAPRPVQPADAAPTVTVRFAAWVPAVALRAAVAHCDPALDVAVLTPLDERGQPTSLAAVLHALASERGDARLRRAPFLWLATGAPPAPLSAAFFLGYPGPFAEFNAVLGRISGALPMAYVLAEDGWVGGISALLVYDGPPDESIDQNRIRYFDPAAVMGLDALAELAQNVLASGHGLAVIAQGAAPTDVRAWDVRAVEDGVVQLRERGVSLDTALGFDLQLFAVEDARATAAFERQFLKADASVGPGYSGGPVLNISGQVIGMVQWEVGGLEGANFAATAADVAAALAGP